MFHTAYQSAWQHPGIAFLAGLPLLGVLVIAVRSGRALADPDPRRRAWLWAFGLLEAAILLDAWMTGALSPLGTAGLAADVAAVAFVIAGDLRFFYFVERQAGDAAPTGGGALRALALALPVSLLVPVGTYVLKRMDPVRYSGNYLYLVYEASVLGVAIAFCALRAPRARDGADGRRRYVRRLLAFEVVQYGLWVAADALILRGHDAGWLLRMVPNALYYGAFAPVATWATPSGTRT